MIIVVVTSTNRRFPFGDSRYSLARVIEHHIGGFGAEKKGVIDFSRGLHLSSRNGSALKSVLASLRARLALARAGRACAPETRGSVV
jgi:hypothetical protein